MLDQRDGQYEKRRSDHEPKPDEKSDHFQHPVQIDGGDGSGGSRLSEDWKHCSRGLPTIL